MAPPDPAALIRLANQCVACGLCLPHCPTYRKTQTEADSPRGRIFMMRAVLEGQAPMSERFTGHIDLCLACRRCEAVCPSRVEYGKLVEGMRAVMAPRRPLGERLRTALALRVAASPAWLGWVRGLLRLGQRSGLASWWRPRESALLPDISGASWQSYYPAHGTASLSPSSLPLAGERDAVSLRESPINGEVGLFLGCASRVLDDATLRAAVFVLNRLGYGVRVPAGQTCCGALHRQAGDAAALEDLARRNGEAFAGLSTVLVSVSGCVASLREGLAERGIAVREMSEFLAAADWTELRPAPLATRIAVHEPCSQTNVLKTPHAPYALLHRIPGAEIIPLPGNDQCCGGAGAYMLTQPDMADALLGDKIEAIRASGATVIASTNLGCALHLARGLKEAGLDVRVAHPVALLAEQLSE